MTTIHMKYWLGANGREHVLPTDQWYLDFATSLLPSIKASPLYNKEGQRAQIDAATTLTCTFKTSLPKSEDGNVLLKNSREYTELICRFIRKPTNMHPTE